MLRTTLLLVFLASCSDAATDAVGRDTISNVSDVSGSGAVLLRPESPRAPVGAPFRLALCSSPAGPALAHLVDTFDSCALRIGGFQQNLLEPDVRDGEAGVTVEVPTEGNALTGFATSPRLQGGVRVSQHAKAVFFATRTATDVPSSAAATSYRLGLRLEIVPMLDPLPLLPGTELPLQVRFDGPELAGAELVLCRGGTVVFRGRTDDAGTIVVPVVELGDHAATVRHLVRREGEVDELLFASLTFHIGEPR